MPKAFVIRRVDIANPLMRAAIAALHDEVFTPDDWAGRAEPTRGAWWVAFCGREPAADQTPFMRKKRIEAHVGGVIVALKLDEKGAVVRCRTEQIRYFDRGYYNNQFDRANPVRRVAVPD